MQMASCSKIYFLLAILMLGLDGYFIIRDQSSYENRPSVLNVACFYSLYLLPTCTLFNATGSPSFFQRIRSKLSLQALDAFPVPPAAGLAGTVACTY